MPSKLETLKGLENKPEAQAAYAIELLETEKNRLIVQAALDVLSDGQFSEGRLPLLKLYAYYDAEGPKRDGEGYLRSSILKALRKIAREEDVRLFEHAALTYEFTPPNHSEEAERIRSAALLALDEVDETLASYHAVRLLVDGYTSVMSGEPALTASRVLAAHENTLPLYQYALQEGRQVTEVLVECLRSLESVPESVLDTLVNKYKNVEDEAVLVGLFDLILGHKSASDFVGFLVEFLRTTRKYAVYHYLTTAMIVSRKEFLLSAFQQLAESEQDTRKIGSLLEALTLARSSRETDTLIKQLRAKL